MSRVARPSPVGDWGGTISAFIRHSTARSTPKPLLIRARWSPYPTISGPQQVTLFHEMGHMFHQILGRTQIASFAGERPPALSFFVWSLLHASSPTSCVPSCRVAPLRARANAAAAARLAPSPSRQAPTWTPISWRPPAKCLKTGEEVHSLVTYENRARRLFLNPGSKVACGAAPCVFLNAHRKPQVLGARGAQAHQQALQDRRAHARRAYRPPGQEPQRKRRCGRGGGRGRMVAGRREFTPSCTSGR